MPAKRSIRMKQRSRAATSKRGTKSARAAWWTSKPAIGVAGVLAILAMIVILVPQSPHAAIGAMKADVTSARAETAAPAPESPTAGHAAIEPLPPSATAIEPVADAALGRVTIVGCLERAEDTYRLTDTAGAEAPTSRSWKSAFLKKRPATIEVRDAVRRVNLASHVGQRVSLTGTLVDREMRVGSLQRVSASCSATAASKVKI